MERTLTLLKYVLSAIGAFFGWFLGGMDGFMTALVWFVVIDYVTGIMVAIIEKKLSSKVGFKEFSRKSLYLCWSVSAIYWMFILLNLVAP